MPVAPQCTISSLKQVFYILFASAFTYAACFSAGTALLRWLRVKLYRPEERFIGFVVGAACLSFAVFAITAAGLAYKGVFLALGIGFLCFYRRSRGPSLPPLPRLWLIVFALPYAVFAVLYLAHALLPEASPDGLVYHVPYVVRAYREHRFPRITTDMFAALPEGAEMLFLFAFAFGKHSATAMAHFLFLLTAPLGMLSYARRIGSPAAGVVGSLLFFLSPVAGKDGTSAYNDVALACTLFTLFYLLQIWREERASGLLVPIGLLAGFAFAIKYTGALAAPYAGGFVLFHLWRARKPVWRPAVIIAACAFSMMAPWMLKNAFFLGNPVAPFGNRFFPNPYYTTFSEQEFIRVSSTINGVRGRELPLEATVGSRLQGIVGPVFLLAPVALPALWSPAGRQLLLAGALFATPYYRNIGTRFLIPPLPFLALAMALVLARWRAAAITVVLLDALASWPAIVHRYSAEPWTFSPMDWRSALRLRPETDFLRDVDGYEIGKIVEETVPAGQRVFSFNMLQQAYQTRETVGGWQSAFGRRIAEDLLTPIWEQLRPVWRHTFRFPQRTARRIRLIQTQREEIDRWSINEVRILRAGVELPRLPQWRLRAQPNPWDAQLAFDNNPVTRWTSAEAYAPGMFVEIDLGAPLALDEVTVECAHDQEGMRMRLEDESGLVAANAEIHDVAPPEGLRRAAVQALNLNGIHWILIRNSELGTNDWSERRPQWGITLAAEHGPFRLYRLD